MTRSSHSRTTIRHSLLVVTAVGGLALAGGLVDSVAGIITGTLYGISGAASAVVCPLVSPVCSIPPM